MDKIEISIADLKLSDELRQKLDGAELPEGVTVQTIIEDHGKNVNAAYREVLAQDSDFTKGFFDEGHKKASGEIYNTLDNQLKQAGYTGDFEDGRGRIPYAKIFSSFKDQIEAATGAKPNEAVKEWQEKYAGLQTQFDELNSSIDQGEHAKVKELTQQLADIKAGQARLENMTYLRGMLPAGDELGVSAENAAIILSNKLDQNYQWGTGENGQFEIKMKDGSYPMSGNGHEVIKDPSKIIAAIIDNEKLRKNSNGNP